jgi:hypothetical protein
MHGNVSVTVEKRAFKLLYEQTFTADFRQRRIEYFVASGAHREQLDAEIWVRTFESIADKIGLP